MYTPITLRDGGPDEAVIEGARHPITEAAMRILTKGGSFQSRHFLEDLMLRCRIDIPAEPCREKKAEVNVP